MDKSESASFSINAVDQPLLSDPEEASIINDQNTGTSSSVMADKVSDDEVDYIPIDGIWILNMVFLGLGFLFLFASFMPLQNFLTNIFGAEIGGTALSFIYIFFSLSGFISPAIMYFTGVWGALMLGGLLYLPLFLACAWGNKFAIYAGAMSCGFGAGLLWPAQGMLVTMRTHPDLLGTANGFFSVFMSSSVFGNMAIGLILSHHKDNHFLVFMIMACGAGVGYIFFFLLLLVPSRSNPGDSISPANSENSISPNPEKKNICSACLRLKDMVDSLFDPRLRYFLLAEFSFVGLIEGWSAAGFNLLIGIHNVTFITTFSGIASICFSMIAGRMFDKILYKKKMVILSCLILLLYPTGGLLVILNIIPKQWHYAMFWCMSGISALGNSFFDTSMMSIYGFSFRDRISTVFALRKLIKSVGVVLTTNAVAHLNSFIPALIVAIGGVLAVIPICFWDEKKAMQEFEEKQKQNQEKTQV